MKDGAWGKGFKKNSSDWKKTEKTITKNPTLRRIRDISEGFKPGSTISTGVSDQQYKDNYDKIDWNKGKKEGTKPKPKFRTKVNGKYQDEE
tara:strand:+ start:1322 stop:1594 length:273 start_codon:yes stop_codon:yes gene_type:complete